MSDVNKKGTVLSMEPSPIAQIHISVRGLVEFVLRHGDIDNSHRGAGGPEVMLEGANIHRMIQKKMGKTYHAEQYLYHVVTRPEYEIVIDGRADGIIIPDEWVDYINNIDENDFAIVTADSANYPAIYPQEKIIIDEIKSTYKDLELLKEPEPVHLAQAKCYAYMFLTKYKLETIGVRMTYCNSETYEVRYFDTQLSRDEIIAWFDDLMSQYIRWADFEVNWKRQRNASIDAISFPYTYREGQKELVARVYQSIENRERLFVMAPTGVGKTLANVYPSLKGLAMGRAEKIFYLTAKTITRTVAADCLNLLRKQSMRLKSVVLTAKEKICPMDEVECNPRKCPYAKGHFDRINDAMYDLLISEDEFSRENIVTYANKHMVCPFEFSLDMSLFADVIICDYNYVFDPNVYLRRFFSEGNSKDYLFLVDEAHNLVDRAMSMYSAQIVKEDVLDIKRLVKDVDARLARSLESVNKKLLEYKRECEEAMVYDNFDDLTLLLLRLNSKIEQFMDDHERFEHMDQVLDFYFSVRHFLNIYENLNDEDYVFFTKHETSGEFLVRLMCANPSEFIRKCTDKARFTVFFSATLLPVNYYRQMLGASDEDQAVYAKSVFDSDNRALLVARDVTRKYSRRSDSEYDRMAEYIDNIVSVRPGNYMIFFPSFAMLEAVYEMYIDRYCDEKKVETVMQNASMSESDREDFISRFTVENQDTVDEVEILYDRLQDNDRKSLLGFCVLGGIFSEGIDLKNDALIGAIIIGTGLPMVCVERELLKRRYDENGFDGFAYAYRYPGMNKVLQAAGRVIRTQDDKGVVALLDERFLGRDYLRLFPREWNNYKMVRCDDIAEYLEDFWSNHNLYD